MKKIYLIFALLGMALFTACDPVEEDYSNNIQQMTAGQLDVTVTVEQQNGKNVNKVKVVAENPLPIQISNGVNTVYSSSAELLLFGKGESLITVSAMNPDGSLITREFKVNVDEMYYEVDPTYNLLFGSGEKIWKWAEVDCLGNGGWRADQQGPEWWKLNPAQVEEQMATEGGNATMKFTLYGKKVEFSNGKSGTIDFAKGNACFAGWYGTFSSTCGVLCGKAFNDCYVPAGTVIKEYQLISVTEDRLVLGWSEDQKNSEWSTGWWWVFEAQ